MDSFDWSQSEFSEFFHVKRVTTESMFVDVWKKFVVPSLDETSGIYNINKMENQQSATPTTTMTSSTSKRNAATGSEPRTSSRKRRAEDGTPHRTLPPSLRPIRVISTEDNRSKEGQGTDQAMDLAIEKAFGGK